MSDEDEQDLMPAALPVAYVEGEENPEQPPTTGEEYLRRVQYVNQTSWHACMCICRLVGMQFVHVSVVTIPTL